MFDSASNRNTRLIALTALAAIAAACGSPQPSASPFPTQVPSVHPTSAPTGTPTPTPSPVVTPAPTETQATAALLLEVTQEGGFIAPSAHLGQLPEVVVDTAGSIYTADPNQASDLLIPSVVVRDVGPAGAQQILAAMKAAGLDTALNSGVAADAGVTVFTAEINGQEVVSRIAQEGPAGPGHPGASAQPAIDLLNRLLDPTQTWGAATSATSTALVPSAYKVYVAPASGASGTTVTWPLAEVLVRFGSPATPNFGVDGLRTGVVSGADATKLAASMGSTPAGTLVTSGGTTYQVWIRPLLPPEIS